MYYAYFRGKANELLAISDVAGVLAQNTRILPIIEPLASSPKRRNPLVVRAPEYAKAGLRVAVITNPGVGKLGDASSVIEEMRKQGAAVTPALRVGRLTTAADIATFQANQAGHSLMFIHESAAPAGAGIPTGGVTHVLREGASSAAYQSTYKAAGAVLRDGFKVMTRNADYPPSSFFSDLPNTHAGLGWTGFADFSIQGDNFKDTSGGPAMAVALHLTDTDGNKDIICRHFVSDSNSTIADPAGKYGEALAKLVAFLNANPGRFPWSTACTEFEKHHAAGHYPGLGTAKRLGFRHHLELLAQIA